MAYEIKQFQNNDVSIHCAYRMVELTKADTTLHWYLSGGSCLNVFAQYIDVLRSDSHSLSHVSFSFVDERFDTEKSNFIQLKTLFEDAYTCSLELGATWIDTSPKLDDQYAMADWYEQQLNQIKVDRTCCVLGIGTDGHIAGIFPDTKDIFEARYLNTSRLIVGFETKNVFPRRFSMTYSGINMQQHLLVYVVGVEKKVALQNSMSKTIPLHICPGAYMARDRALFEIFTDITV